MCGVVSGEEQCRVGMAGRFMSRTHFSPEKFAPLLCIHRREVGSGEKRFQERSGFG